MDVANIGGNTTAEAGVTITGDTLGVHNMYSMYSLEYYHICPTTSVVCVLLNTTISDMVCAAAGKAETIRGSLLQWLRSRAPIG